MERDLDPRERRASDADRELAVAQLRAAVAGGALSIDELDDRMGLVFRARTVGELAGLTWDLPASDTTRRKRRSIWRSAGFRYHATAYGLTNGFILGTWAVTGAGFFWPFFPAMGWGVGLGLHALAAHGAAQRKSERDIRRVISGHTLPVLPITTTRSTAPERRFVAVLFTDIANSTALTEALGDSEWSRVRTRHRDLLRDCFASHNGAEVGSQGDGFLARFDSPVDAVRCAIELQRRLDQQRGSAGFAPTVRMGVHSGDAVEEEGDLVGQVINLASRVMAEAGPGEILVTEPVAEHLDARFELEERGLRSLKGVSRPRHLLAVRWSG